MKKIYMIAFVLVATGLKSQISLGQVISAEQHFYKVELIEKYAKKLKLSSSQISYMKKEYKIAKKRFDENNEKLKGETQILKQMASEEIVNEQKILQQLQKVLALENTIKAIRLTLYVRLKNKLTPTQKRRLDKLRE
ncbi:hypothetical protein BKI52_31805 [marine bacterium AO1-C]|nr:hypothetical protein BKI52_31805 [marine bacterium AO1-C]